MLTKQFFNRFVYLGFFLLFGFWIFLSLTQADSGIFHGEFVFYDSYLLGQNSIFEKVFNVYENDTYYRAREIGNFINLIDASFINLSLKQNKYLFISFTHYVILFISFVCVIGYPFLGKRRLEKKIITLFLFIIFLQTHTVFVSGFFHFRTSKILVCGLIFLLFYFLSQDLFLRKFTKNPVMLTLVLMALALVDEQGFLILIFITLWSLGYYLYSFQKHILKFFLLCSLSIGFRFFYFYVIGPYFHKSITSGQIDFERTQQLTESFITQFQQIDFYLFAWETGMREIGVFFGQSQNIIPMGFFICFVSLLYLGYLDLKFWRRRTLKLQYLNFLNPCSYRSISYLLAVFFIGILTQSMQSSINAFYYSLPFAGLHFVLHSTILVTAVGTSKHMQYPLFILLGLTCVYGFMRLPTYHVEKSTAEMAHYYQETKKVKDCLRNRDFPISSFNFAWEKRFGDKPELNRNFGNFAFLCQFLRNKKYE